MPLLTNTGANTGAAEPSIKVDRPGNVYVTGPEGVPTGGCPFWTVTPGTLNANSLPYFYRGRFDVDYHALAASSSSSPPTARRTVDSGRNGRCAEEPASA